MQFVTQGPDIPDALLQAHEEGRVVFFCGAGISYPADLPGFKGLVEQIYQLNGTAPSDIEYEAFERGQFDATLDLLERRLPGQRLAVRRALAQALKPKLRRKGATDTQAALLLHGGHKRHLVFRAAPSLAARALAAQVGVIDPDVALQGTIGLSLAHGFHQFVLEQPGCPPRDPPVSG